MIRIVYQDTYANTVYIDNADTLPRVGDAVVFDELDEFVVRSVTWYIRDKEVVIILAEPGLPGTRQQPADPLKLIRTELSALQESVTKQEKKSRTLTDNLHNLTARVKSTETKNKKNEPR